MFEQLSLSMLKLSDLIRIISKRLAMHIDEVALYARRLREAGLLPRSSGRHYPTLNQFDCARLVVGILTAENAAEAPVRVAEYKQFVDRLAEIVSDIEWAKEIAFVRVRRHSGEVEVQDMSGRFQPAGFLACASNSELNPNIELTVSIKGDVLRDIARALGD